VIEVGKQRGKAEKKGDGIENVAVHRRAFRSAPAPIQRLAADFVA
jgi:hypothetical protein